MKNGDRVRLSPQAKRANIRRTRDQEQRGTFMGLERGFYIKVLWDGNKSVGTGYHPDFIEPDAPEVTNGDRG
jgi:hypothetical protein